MNNKYQIIRSIKEGIKIIEINEGYQFVGIETEFGDKELICDINLSHHGSRSHLTPPSGRWDLYGQYKYDTMFLFSHLDMDSLLGLWILEGKIEDNDTFRKISDMIMYIDMHGGHRFNDKFLEDKFAAKLNYFNIIIKNNYKLFSRKLKTFEEILDIIYKEFINLIKYNIVPDHIFETVHTDQSAYNSLDKKLSIPNLLHVYISNKSFVKKYAVNHEKYNSTSKFNIQYIPRSKKISFSAWDEDIAKQYFGEKGVLGPLVDFFGEDSGGRITIGGSPKHKQTDYNTFLKFLVYVKEILKNNIKKE